ncbi:GMP reductase 1 isoform X5 [Anomalospiza imberbis]|uniref:GMP reductase 1 isoform X5 n=1 Tax=Anomalospiza imberbis TaxID=187417 RepID=UPI00358E7EC9
MPRVDADLKLDFKDVLVRPKRSSLKSRAEVDLMRTFTFRNSKQTYTGIPIIVANMDTVGTFEMAVVMAKHAMFTAIHKHYSLEEWKLFAANHPECLEHVAASSGSGQDDLKKLTSILEAIPAIKYICLDVANGYSEHFVEFVKSVRALFPHHTIMAGNVVTGEMVEELIISGADIIKVGIGPGSVCTTRIKTGVGYPQLSAVIECADSAHGLKGHIISGSEVEAEPAANSVTEAQLSTSHFEPRVQNRVLFGQAEFQGEVKQHEVVGQSGGSFKSRKDVGSLQWIQIIKGMGSSPGTMTV